MRALNVLLALLVSALLAAALLEGGLRLIGLGKPVTVNRFDATLGWSKRPGARVTRKTSEYEVVLEINDLGLRDDPMSTPEKPEGVFRVICLGDSFTLGYSVAREDLFVDMLERWWRAEGRPIEVINAGTEGWSTDQEVVWFLEHGAAFEPDLVLIFSYENDLYWNGQEDYFGKGKPYFTEGNDLVTGEFEDASGGSWLSDYALLRPFAREKEADSSRHTFLPDGGTHEILAEWGALLSRPPPFIRNEAMAGTTAALAALRDRCSELGAELYLAPIPSKSAIDEEHAERFGSEVLGLPREYWSPEAPIRAFYGAANSAGINFLEVIDDFRTRALQGEQLYYEHDWHLNPTGNAALATYLHEELDRQGVVPLEKLQEVDGIPAVLSDAEGAPGWLVPWLVLLALLSTLYAVNWRDEPLWLVPLKIGALLAVIFAIVLGGALLLEILPERISKLLLLLFVLAVLGFVLWKLGRRLGTMCELLKAFTLRGHWYLLPLLTVLLTVGSLLVVAASSPLVAPFIYTLF